VRWLRAFGVTGLALSLVCACAAPEVRRASTYAVRADDTLYSIAWRHNLDYRDLAKWNGIGSDYRIAVGQVLSLVPRASTMPPARGRPTAGGTGRPPAPAASGTPASGPPAAPQAAPSLAWVWPTDITAPPRAMPSGGILLLGQPGQAVRAAAPGRVVYTGSGLRGYGQLVIIKHGETLLSAYAYNRELSVHEGEQVVGGQKIAAMGQGAQQSAALYFEIRLNGKPTDPLPYLRGKK
jgi:lipoprotein NlpD